jgi:hypothetical protein
MDIPSRTSPDSPPTHLAGFGLLPQRALAALLPHTGGGGTLAPFPQMPEGHKPFLGQALARQKAFEFNDSSFFILIKFSYLKKKIVLVVRNHHEKQWNH